ncbi:MAG: Mur ligase family protein [Patescibacteria group bacterium]
MKIHFIGICGVAMSGLAIALNKKGFIVSGSDKGFFPPISTHLNRAAISYYPGWHPDKMIQNGVPDLVIVGNVASSQNPEWQFVLKNKIKYKSYPEAVAEYFVKKNSIVCAGTYGKTSSSALLAWILRENNFAPGYMFGGLAINEIDSAEISESDWSVLEGDEYKSARWDNEPKFSHYSPTHLLLTAVNWDHADVYPTEDSYFKAFADLVRKIPKNGLIVACADNENSEKVIAKSDCKIVRYGKTQASDYSYANVRESKFGLEFDIIHSGDNYQIKSGMLGKYQAENITGVFAMANEIGIEAREIVQSIATFKGMKRRLEKKFEGEITVLDDIAHSPLKAKSALQTVRKIYSGKIIAVFEPNAGNRQPESAPGYDHAFQAADTVIIPRLTKIKIDEKADARPIEGEELKNLISKTHNGSIYIDNDDALINYIIQNAYARDAVIFLGSHGWRGMIEELVEKLSRLNPDRRIVSIK